MTTYTLSIVVDGKDNASGPLSKVGSALSSMGTIAGGILAAGFLQNLGQSIVDFGRKALDSTAQMQAFETGLQALVARELRMTDQTLSLNQALDKSVPIVGNLADELRRIAITSPYELGVVQDTFRLGMAFGFTSTEAAQLTKGILNMGAGVGASNEMLGRMSYNFAQIRMQGKVTGVDIRQLAMAGFDLVGALKGIGQQFGLTINDHNDFNAAIASGQLTWEQFAEGFEKYADENFGGAANRMSRTMQGLKSTFNDLFILTMPKILGPAAEKVTGFFSKLLDIFIQFTESGALEKFGERLAQSFEIFDRMTAGLDVFSNAINNGKSATEAMGAALENVFGKKTLKAINTFMTDLPGMASGLGNVFAAIGGAGLTGLFASLGGGGLAASLGGMMAGLPAMLGGVLATAGTALGGTLFTSILLGFSKLSPALGGAFFKTFMIGGTMDKIVAFFATTFGKMGAFASFLTPLATALGPIGIGLTVAMLALTAFGAAMQAANGDMSLFTGIGAKLQEGLNLLGQFWTEQGPAISEIGEKVFSAIGEAANTLAETVLPWLGEKFNQFGAWFVTNGPLITQFIDTLATFFTENLLPAVVSFWGVVQPILDALFTLIGGIGVLIMQVATGDWAGAWETIKTTVTTAGEFIWQAILGFLDTIATLMGSDLASIKEQWSSNWDQFKQIVSQVGEILKTTIADFMTRIYDEIINKLNRAIEFVLTLKSKMENAGENIMQGLYDGINSMLDLVLGLIRKVSTKISGLFTGLNRIQSPSKLYFGFGEYMMQGLANGIDFGSRAAIKAIEGQSKALSNSFTGNVSASLPAGGAAAAGGNTITINVDGSKDPEAVAREIAKLLKAQGVGV